MLTLFLSAPGVSQSEETVRTFDLPTIFSKGTAPDYAITDGLIEQVSQGMRVVVFDRECDQQMEGTVSRYRPTTKAANGLQRYDIEIADRTMVPYSNPPSVNLCGVGVG